MTGAAHTPGKLEATITDDSFPWIHIYCADGKTLWHQSRPDAEKLANRDRLVAMWNACEGIPNPSVVGEAIEALRQIRVILHWYDGDTNALGDAFKVANVALAKLDGSAS